MSSEASTANGEFHSTVEAIRRFNRLYTRRIGLLRKDHLGSGWSLTETRILFELSQQAGMTASALCEGLELDQGYVSRILARFEKKGLIARRVSPDDARIQVIALTRLGQKTFAGLDARAHGAIADLLRDKPAEQRQAMARAARTFEHVLGDVRPKDAPIVIRPPRPGDIGWVIHRHGVLICKEFGWDIGFEVKVAEILGSFGKHPGREQGWIAERDGEILGSVFVIPDDEETARLRVLYVEQNARGHGLGRQLVDLCITFARQSGYRRLVLWTHDFQKPARHIYEAAGFRLVSSEPHCNFGVQVLSETWELDLKPQ
jgi:DNA-binding MarR family transcriptional regulator/GNAT superfamily N-acetyltransferase